MFAPTCQYLRKYFCSDIRYILQLCFDLLFNLRVHITVGVGAASAPIVVVGSNNQTPHQIHNMQNNQEKSSWFREWNSLIHAGEVQRKFPRHHDKLLSCYDKSLADGVSFRVAFWTQPPSPTKRTQTSVTMVLTSGLLGEPWSDKGHLKGIGKANKVTMRSQIRIDYLSI